MGEIGDTGDIGAFAQAAQDAAAAGRFDQARALLARALSGAQEQGRYRLVAVLFDRLGQMLERQGEAQDAVVAYESGLRALAAGAPATTPDPPDPTELDEVLRRLGAVSKQFGDYRDLAVPDVYSAPTARDLAQAAQDPLLPVRLLINVGSAYLRQPQEEPALNAYTLALNRPELADAPRLRGYILANLGEIHRRRGQLAQAAEELDEAVRLLERAGEAAETRRAVALQAGIARDQGDPDRALALYTQALALYAQSDDTLGEGRACAGLGHLYRLQNQFAKAAQAFRRALDLATQAGDQETLWHVYWGLGVCQQAAGQLDEAVAALETSLRLIDARHQELRTDEGKVTFLDSVGGVFDQLIALHMLRGRNGAAEAYADALQVAEQARGRALADLLGDQRRYRPRPAADVAADLQLPQGDPFAGFNMAAQMAPALASPPHPAPDTHDEAADGAPAAADLPPLDRLVFHLLDDQTAVLAVAADGRVQGHSVPQGRAQMAARVAALRAALAVDDRPRGVDVQRHLQSQPSPAGPVDHRPLLRAFYDDLVAPVAAALPAAGTLLAVEPHGALWLLPFAALVDEQGGWLADRRPLLYTPSAAVLDEIRAEARRGEPAARQTLIAGNPTMPPVPEQDGLAVTLASLPGAEQEAQAIAALLDPARYTLLLGAAASLARVQAEAPQQDILHLATHGIAYSDEPRASFVALAASPGDDGLLTVRRVLGWAEGEGLRADLVTLSACQTGLGRLSGDGMLGLSRAFLIAGARAVLVSQWSVSDRATAQLMALFYRGYLAGGDKATALAQAMQTLRQSAEFADPRYWAAFSLVGAAS
ncbi:MAG: CHAT domain-containing protein [Caldilineaceae bacterium]|nr:CHAT domain-containing protein [Caldilineaceae bacterium]